MTKKDYDNIARAIAHAFQYCDTPEQIKGVEHAKRQLIAQLDGNYHNFDRFKFLNACNVGRRIKEEQLAD